MQTFGEQLAALPSLQQVLVPDLWQQKAVSALRSGQDVVVHAPTGAGKTLIFELWSNQGRPRGQAIYTVPTRALANDKLAEWRARGWEVGIATGDLAENLEAPVLVATLETQKNRLIRGDGPTLLAVDEYQMIGDPDRGLNYELAIALAPARTQLLLLSGSVGNPQDVVKWLRRLGRDAVLVRDDERPVPLEEVHAEQLSYSVPGEIRGYWPRLVAKALAENLGPILVFAPRRQAAEALAEDLARQLPNPNPLTLSPAQRQIAGERLARLLKARVAFHHSGLSYGARAGVIEPLAKAGQLRAVVATMGLAAGINFSLRSVALAGESYRRDQAEQLLQPDEILQMYGRAGRRGIDEVGYAIVTGNGITLLDAHARHLARNGMVDWGALLGLMTSAAEREQDPFKVAVEVQQRLFTSKPILLGVEESLRHPDTPCGLKTDAERARHVRRRVREMRNSRGAWERYPSTQERTIKEIQVLSDGQAAGGAASPAEGGSSLGSAAVLRDDEPGGAQRCRAVPPGDNPGLGGVSPHHGRFLGTAGDDHSPGMPLAGSDHTLRLRPVLGEPAALEKVGFGQLCVLQETDGERQYGRTFTVAERLPGDRVLIAKWVRRMTNWHGRQVGLGVWRQRLLPLVEQQLARRRTPAVQVIESPEKISVRVSLSELTMRVPVDSYGVPLWQPPLREVFPPDCSGCTLVETCRALPTGSGTAMLWRRLALVDAAGAPTLRGRLVSCFAQGDGLAIAAGLEDVTYPLEEMIYDLANLAAGFRFAGDENRWAGRLALACHQAYGLQTIPGYLENGLPPKYGAGAEVIVATVHKQPERRHSWVSEVLGPGDVDRVIIEWRSLLRQVGHAPSLEWERWKSLQRSAREVLHETESPTITDLPPLEFHQQRRVDHRLVLRRH